MRRRRNEICNLGTLISIADHVIFELFEKLELELLSNVLTQHVLWKQAFKNITLILIVLQQNLLNFYMRCYLEKGSAAKIKE